MAEEIRVYVVDYGRKNLMMRARIPGQKQQPTKSTGTANRREAERIAAKWEHDLNEGRYNPTARMSWDEFYRHYLTHGLGGVKPETAAGYLASVVRFAKHAKPRVVGDFTTDRVTAYVTYLRQRGLAEPSIAAQLRNLKRSARWAHEQGLLFQLPYFKMPKKKQGQKTMRGGPITTEEFERMLKKAEDVVGLHAAPSWRFYLKGLWASGLRLGESLLLRWDYAPGAIEIDFSGRHPLLIIPGESQKSGEDQLLPVVPEFAELLDLVPPEARNGWVFRPLKQDGEPFSRNRFSVGPIVSEIGRQAGVVVNERRKGEKSVRKFASAHDLRRSFGSRLARLLSPAELKDVMRHKSIATTETYYIELNAQETADKLWRSFGKQIGNTPPQRAGNDESENAANLNKQTT